MCARSSCPISSIFRDAHDTDSTILCFASRLAILLESTIGVLVLDALWRDPHFSHYSLAEAVQLARTLQPVRTLIIGITCEMGAHEDVNKELAALKDAEGLDVQLGYDGQVLADLPLQSKDATSGYGADAARD